MYPIDFHILYTNTLYTLSIPITLLYTANLMEYIILTHCLSIVITAITFDCTTNSNIIGVVK